MSENKRYIVYPYGALSGEEIYETVELLKVEGANPKIITYNGFWTVSAERKPILGPQDPPDDNRIFKGTPTEFFKKVADDLEKHEAEGEATTQNARTGTG